MLATVERQAWIETCLETAGRRSKKWIIDRDGHATGLIQIGGPKNSVVSFPVSVGRFLLNGQLQPKKSCYIPCKVVYQEEGDKPVVVWPAIITRDTDGYNHFQCPGRYSSSPNMPTRVASFLDMIERSQTYDVVHTNMFCLIYRSSIMDSCI